MILNKTMNFLTNLNQNNNLEWMHSHKNEKNEAMAEFENFVLQLNQRIADFDSTIEIFNPKELIYRLNRDIRFSHDKTPYKTAFSAHVGPKGKLFIPTGYFIQISPIGETFIGGGLYASNFKEATEQVRENILKKGAQFQKILNSASFKKMFTLEGEKLKNPPRGFSKDSPYIELLKHKSWYVENFFESKDFQQTTEDFLDQVIEKFKSMKPFKDFLNDSLKNFTFPERS